MSLINLLWFGGMIPRAGEQHMPPPHASEAENTNLYSGELRPLHKPSLAHRFAAPGDDDFITFPPIDPSLPPGETPGERPPTGPGDCIEPYFTVEPRNEAGIIGRPTTFSAEINQDADQPVFFQWYRNGAYIPGATGKSLTITVTAENFQDFYQIVARNDCGAAVSKRVQVDLNAPDQCKDYECFAMEEAVIGIQGYGMWPLLDGNSEPVVPDVWEHRQLATYWVGLEEQEVTIQSDSRGNNWGNVTQINRTTVDPTKKDLNLCEGPFVATNREGDSDEFDYTPRPKWNGNLPNVVMAVAARGFSTDGAGEPTNYLFRGILDFHFWGQLSIIDSGVGFDIRVGQRDRGQGLEDYIVFNHTAASQWRFYMPAGTLVGNGDKRDP